ncbi:MAG: M43 family zinc metalloprotease [Microscillaceae bacterium]|nr:M43 family zinc metalloprotease [Microscillaceae bacterium]MDW8461413.1 M43 family zinc metalloprotease [Cytophagales bacterium]
MIQKITFSLMFWGWLLFAYQSNAQTIQELQNLALPSRPPKTNHTSQKEGLYLKDFNQKYLQERGKIRCYTTEYNEQLHKNNPNFDIDFERWIQAAIAKRKRDIANGTAPARTINGVYYIPVVVHVIHNGEAIGTGSNISNARVQDQINVLNEDFRKIVSTPGYNTHPDGADTRIEFVLAKRTPTGAATNGINRIHRNTFPNHAANWKPGFETTYINNTIKPNSIWDPTEYMNMWVVQFGGADLGLLGYAQFPESPLQGMSCNIQTANTDGVVMGYQYFGRGLTPPYGEGRTATHEVGHMLGLRHIWGDATCGNDFCADTPVHQTANGGCPTHPKPNSCGTPDEMFENYMDYTDDLCMNIFTYDQATRMRTVLENSPRRRSLLTSPALLAPATNYGGIVNITSPLGNVCGTFTPTVVLRNLGSNNLTSATISYQINGGTPQTVNWTGNLAYKATTNVNLPSQTLANGNHSIRVWVSVSNGSSHSHDIYVNEIISNFSVGTAAAIPFLENFESNIFPPANWYIDQAPANCNTWFEQTGDNGTNGATVARLPLGDNTADDFLYTSLIDLTTATGNVTLSFDVFRSDGGTVSLRVDIQPCGSTTWTNVFNQSGTTLVNTNNTWVSKSVNLSNTYNGQIVRFRFYATSTATTGFLRLDNIRVIDSVPRISFANTAITVTENNANSPLTGDCRPFALVNIPVQTNVITTNSVVVAINVSGGTATNNVDFEVVNPTVTFPASSTANQNFQIRIYDDPALESVENITFNLTIQSGTALLDNTNLTHTLTINDNDTHPQPSVAGATLFSENFESGSAPGWTQYTTSGAVNIWRVGTQRLLNGNFSAYVSQSAASGNYNTTVEGAALFQSPVINATAYSNNQLRVTFNFQCNGERFMGVDYDFGSLYYALAATPTTWVLIEGANPSPYRGVTTTTTRIVNLPAALQGQQFHLAWRWDNDDSVGNQPAFVIDNIVVEALPFTGVPVQTNTYTAPAMANRLYLGPNSLNYAYNPSNGNLVARIQNTTSHNYGCTQVFVDRAGTSAVQFTTTLPSQRLASKTFRIIPATNNPSGTYNIRFYYTNAEITGWESNTGQSRTNALIHKYPAAISSANLGDNSTQSTSNTHGSYGADFWIEGNFSNGFSGFGIGISIPPNPLPLQLLDFSAQTQLQNIRLLWRVANEININRYVIEKSYDLYEFFDIGEIEARNLPSYDFLDISPRLGKNYYRLRIEEQGTISYSDIIVADWGQGTSLNLYPIPANDKLYLNIANFENTPIQVKLFNHLGQQVLQEYDNLRANESYNKEINVSSLSRGLYILEVTTTQNKHIFKVILQ